MAVSKLAMAINGNGFDLQGEFNAAEAFMLSDSWLEALNRQTGTAEVLAAITALREAWMATAADIQKQLATLKAQSAQIVESNSQQATSLAGVAGDVARIKQKLDDAKDGMSGSETKAVSEELGGIAEVLNTAAAGAKETADKLAALDAETPEDAPVPVPTPADPTL